MTDVTGFWHLPSTEQQTIQKEVGQEAEAQEPGQLPARSTLVNAFEAETELAVCASLLFIAIVQDCFELGGGYRVHVIALTSLITKHFDEIGQVEDYLAESIPYSKHALVWVPLPSYHSGKSETEHLKKFLWKEND